MPSTGADMVPVLGIGLILAACGGVLWSAVRRHRDPIADDERLRRRDWDRLARGRRG